MNIEALGNRLVLKEIQASEKTKSGILLPNVNEEKEDFAEVISISKDIKDSPVKVGDKVLFKQYKKTSINDGDTRYLVIDLDDIVAIVNF